MMFNKRGITPVIATALLVGLAVVIAFIIFLWAKSTLAEQYLKFNEPVERSCDSINFESEIYRIGNEYKFSVVNRGNVPLYGFKIYHDGDGEVKEVANIQCIGSNGAPITLANGESCEKSILGVNSEMNVIVVPQMLAERGNQEVPYTCDRSFGEEIDVP